MLLLVTPLYHHMQQTNFFKGRIIGLSIIVVFIGLVVITELFFVQVVHGDYYTKEADDAYVAQSSEEARGSIYLTTKDDVRVSGATMKSGFIVALNPTLYTGTPESLFATLQSVLPELTLEKVTKSFGRKKDTYEELAHRVPESVAEEISELGINGITVHREEWRYYPGDDMLAQTLGFVAFSGGDIRKGQYGLERQYEDNLKRGKDSLQVNLFAEIFADLNRAMFDSGHEADIVTTIEPTVQDYLEQSMDAVAEKYSTRFVNGIIINPKTGEIYAMGQTPRFDLNNFSEVSSPTIYQNSLVDNIYEFGSVVKPLVIAAGLNEGVIHPDDTYYDAGYVDVEDKRINNFDKKGRGTVTMTRALGESLNTAMVLTSQKLGNERFGNYMRNYGLGEKTGIDLPNEARGRLQNLQSPRDLEYATASFGQGISFNVMALVRALSALGNGGYLVNPHIVKEISYVQGEPQIIQYSLGEQTQVITAETSETITDMLVEIVDEIMAEGKHSLPHYSIAAKTGTAQIPNPAGGYYDDRNLHSFFGYFPAYDPQFLIYLGAHEPKGVRYASETLSEPFFDIVQFLINYYEIEPDR